MYSTFQPFILTNKKDTVSNFENYFFESINLFDSQDLTFSYKNSDNKNSIFDINSSENVIKNKNSFLNLENKDFLDKSYDITFFKYPQIQTSHFTKLYIPKPFTASPSNIYNGLPWFLDYVHLTFWFFFFSTILSVFFIIYFFSFIWNNQESRYPIRETRGFSRAQTGDTLTAIIPMTWSITMLLHASMHSTNFDENTTGTQFCLTVIAYQWGWNYYYPKDIINNYNNTPIRVGRGGVDHYINFENNYNALLDFSRNYILNKNLLLGVGSSRVGKNNIQTMQSLFFKSFNSNQNIELPTSLFVNLNFQKNNTKLQLLNDEIKKAAQHFDDININYTHNNNDLSFNSINPITLNNLNNIDYLIFLSYDKFNAINFYKNLELNFLVKNFNFNFFFSKIFNFNDISNQHSIKNIFFKQFYSNDLLKVKTLDSHRNKNTFFSNSNKLFLVYKYLIDSIDDTDNKVSNDNYCKFYDMLSNRLLIQNIVRRQYKSFNSHVDDLFDSDIFNENLNYTNFEFPTTLNVTINQWLHYNNYNFFNKNQLLWLDFINFNFFRFNNDLSYFFINNYANLNLSDNFLNIFFLFNTNCNLFNFKMIYQSFLYLAPDNSYLFNFNSLLTFEDFGFNSNSSTKEFWYKNLAYSNYFNFNIINFYNSELSVNYFNIKNFFFNKFNKVFNFKFWDFDYIFILFKINYFQENMLYNFNDSQKFVTEYLLSWPNLIRDFNKISDLTFLNYKSISNLCSFNHYLINTNFLKFKYLVNFNFYTKLLNNRQNKNFNKIYLYINPFEQFVYKKFYFKFECAITDLLPKLFYFKNQVFFNKTYFLFQDLNIYDYSTINLNLSYYDKVKTPISSKNLVNSFFIDFYLFFFEFKLKPYLFIKMNTYNNVFIDFNNYEKQLINLFCLNLKTLLNLPNFQYKNLYWDIFFKKIINTSSISFEKPVRFTYKFNDPRLFNIKLTNDTPNVFYNNKILFLWQNSWSAQVQNFNLPLYKFFRGNVEKKNNLGFSNTNGASSPTLNEDMFDNYKIVFSKNFTDSRANWNYWHKSKRNNSEMNFGFVLDSEKFNFFKNYLTNLPNINDDLDINYILKYLNFDINTSRRNDHLSKFKIFWGPLFTKYIKKLSTNIDENLVSLNTLNIKNINFFKNYSLNILKFDSFYLYNVSLQKNYFLSSLSIYSNYSNLKINFLKNNFFWNFNLLSVNSLLEFKQLNALTSDFNSNNLNWFFYKNILLSYFIKNTNFLFYWSNLWSFKDNLTSFNNKLFFSKNFKYNSDLLNKLLIISSFNEKEIMNIHESNVKTSSSLIFSNNFLINDIKNLLSLYQNNLDIKNNSLSSDNSVFLLFNDLNFFKYDSFIYSNYNIIKLSKSLYYNYYLLQLQKSTKSRFEFKEINNNISSIKRLRVSKGICLPSDFSIHILCGSKDVIHSWAIPGLGIKIDCIPGFNSHRRVLFRWRGVYWGQCMEVCGRYHHWMPILIKIVHKDLFLLWCLSYLRALDTKNFRYEKYFFDEVLLLNWISNSNNSDIILNYIKNIKLGGFSDEQLSFIETILF